MKAREGHLPQPRPMVNAGSSLLTVEENEAVFSLLGSKCQTLSTAVVQIFKTENSTHPLWRKIKSAVIVCFVKDGILREHFLRAFCLMEHEMIWEHKLRDGMKILKARPFLLTFEGHDCCIGLNFAAEDECEAFYNAVGITIQARNRKNFSEYFSRRRATPCVSKTAVEAATQNIPRVTDSSKTSITKPPASAKSFLSAGVGFLPASSNRIEKRKITKEDISSPTNFVHVCHVGWDADTGFNLTGTESDVALAGFFAKAGVSKIELSDRETRNFIYDFIKTNNVWAASVSVPPARLPPPVPLLSVAIAASPASTRSSPSPSLCSSPTPPPPPPPSHALYEASITTPISLTTTTVMPDSRSDLMESIREGTRLRKVDCGTADPRNDQVSEILPNNRNSYALALRHALLERDRATQTSDEGSDSPGINDEWND